MKPLCIIKIKIKIKKKYFFCEKIKRRNTFTGEYVKKCRFNERLKPKNLFLRGLNTKKKK